jgi:hypothetical protein
MSNEEFDRRIEFIIEQQAQFASDIIQLRQAQSQTAQIAAQTSQTVAETSQVVAQTGEIVTRLARVTLEGFKDVNAKISSLVDSQIRTAENMRLTDERFKDVNAKINSLVDSQIRTDENVASDGRECASHRRESAKPYRRCRWSSEPGRKWTVRAD